MGRKTHFFSEPGLRMFFLAVLLLVFFLKGTLPSGTWKKCWGALRVLGTLSRIVLSAFASILLCKSNNSCGCLLKAGGEFGRKTHFFSEPGLRMFFLGCFAFGFFLEGDAPVRNLPNKAMMVISTTLNHPEIILGTDLLLLRLFSWRGCSRPEPAQSCQVLSECCCLEIKKKGLS